MNRVPCALDLVLIGGGHAHVHVLKMFGMPEHRRWVEESGVQITLIAKDLLTPYSGMLPGFVAGHYSYDDIHLDLVKICAFSNVRLIHAAATRITYNNASGNGGGFIDCDDDRPPIRFDAVSIDIGITPSMASMSLATQQAIIPVKPIANFCHFYRQLQATIMTTCDRNEKQEQKQHRHTIAVVGGGAGGIELALSMDHYFSSQGYGSQVQLVLYTRGDRLLESHNKGVQNIFQRVLKERNIPVYHGAEVTGVEPVVEEQSDPDKPGRLRKLLILSPESIQCSGTATPIVVDDVLWCTQASAASWLSDFTPFKTTKQGNYIRINSSFESVSHRGVFACGDCCHMVEHPRPKAGVFAVRAGPPLLENLKNYLSNRPLKHYAPQRDFLGLISTGNKYAVASKGWWLTLEGKFLWTIKDWIDRTWMEKYKVLPDLEEMMAQMAFTAPNKRRKLNNNHGFLEKKGLDVLEAFQTDPMRCGGCGAKVGTTTVSRVLQSVYRRQVDRALNKLGQEPPPPIDHDDASIIELPKKGGGAIVQTIDYFRSLISDPFYFGKIVAVHALSDVHAMGAKAQSALVLAVVPFAADEAITESVLTHLLSGISDVLQVEGIQLAGGHTCEGLELACGLSVQGYMEQPHKLLRKRGGRVGDKIVLTKPLGTGALFAANMRAQCRGEFVAQAIESMVQSNGPASLIAMESRGVHACTDCTGFGLIGHLLEMLIANEVSKTNAQKYERIGALLSIRNMKFLDGGLEASRNGIFSSLQPQNQRSRRAVINHSHAVKNFPVEYPLIYDPQTAGGLLFFVNPNECDEFVAKLTESYPCTAVIGELTKYPEDEASIAGGVCPVGSEGVSTGQRVRIEL